MITSLFNICISILSYDIWFYISHLILHTKYCWRYHKDHHKNITSLKYTDAYVSHWVEIIFQGVGMFFPYLLLKYNFTEFIITLIMVNIKGMLRHDHRCAWLIGNHHLLHHVYLHCNYGDYWIDYICNTLYVNKKIEEV
jgi:lathosterol oxidase